MAYAPSKSKKNPGEAADMPNLTAMMDMMTIILLFLLKSLSVSGALLHPAETIELPHSEKYAPPEQHLSFIINNLGIFEDIDGNIGKHLVYEVEMESDEIQIFTGLTTFLDSIRTQNRVLGRAGESIVTLQGDNEIKYKYIYKFIQSCGYSGFGTIQFIVEKKEG